MSNNLEFQTLDDRAIILQLGTLRNRIEESFPTRGLTQTATHLSDIS
jgi:hypothetical protein